MKMHRGNMKILSSNEKGIALVTALMFTLISLTIVMALLYMITRSTQISGQQKKYKTSLEAAYGGTEIITKDIIPMILSNTSISTITDTFEAIDMEVFATQNCLQSKLTLATKNWPAGCSNTPNPKKEPDLTFQLSAATGNPFTVYSKIVDTSSGNSDVSGLQLEGSGVAEGSSLITPQHFPYIYRVEVQGERENNSTAQANIEVLYAY